MTKMHEPRGIDAFALKAVDLNSDLGEGCGSDEQMLAIVTSANIACGGHAGDAETMRRTVAMAIERSVRIGAHPSYPDREGFGRRRMACTPRDIRAFVASQTEALMQQAGALAARVLYVKPHGALGNDGASDPIVANAVLDGLADLDSSLAVLAISGTELERAAKQRGIPVFPEVYADRAYTDAGTLAPRAEPGAVIENIQEATLRLRRYAESGLMPTSTGRTVTLAGASICVHGDNPHAVEMAREVREMLSGAGVRIAAFL